MRGSFCVLGPLLAKLNKAKISLPGGCVIGIRPVDLHLKGIKALGAHRWLNLKIVTLQPAELAKLTLIIYLAAWFSYKERERFLAFLILLFILVGLVVVEPDLGT